MASFRCKKFLGTLQSRILELDWTEVQVGSSGWVVKKDFHENFQVNGFLCFPPMSLTELAHSGMTWKVSSPCTS